VKQDYSDVRNACGRFSFTVLVVLVVLVPARRGGKKEIARGQSERDAAGNEGEGREGRGD